jgi:hypothetical protein
MPKKKRNRRWLVTDHCFYEKPAKGYNEHDKKRGPHMVQVVDLDSGTVVELTSGSIVKIVKLRKT